MKAAFRRLMRPLLEHQVKRLIARHQLKVVAVAGSVGKTTTKTAIATVLGQKYKVLDQTGYFSNFNSEIGLPLAVFQLQVPSPIINPFTWISRLYQMERTIRSQYPYQVLVLELGTERPGEIAEFMRYLKPDFGVVTAVAPEHMEFFKTIEAVAEEEFTLARGSKQAVLNDTFDRLHPLAKGLRVEPIWYSDQTFSRITSLLKSDHAWDEGCFPRHIRQAIGAAVAVATEMKLNENQIVQGVLDFRGVPGRMQILDGINSSIIIDDTYNSSPDAVAAALLYLRDLHVKGRRIFIMGSMNELGDKSPQYHADAGTLAANVDLLVTIGKLANEYSGAAAVAAGLDQSKVIPTESPYAAGQLIKPLLAPGDVVLAKGSQNGVFAEEAVKMLLANPSDSFRLVRQSAAWQTKKRAQFTDAV